MPLVLHKSALKIKPVFSGRSWWSPRTCCTRRPRTHSTSTWAGTSYTASTITPGAVGFFQGCGSESRRAKMTHKRRNFPFWSAGCSLLRAEGFFCNLDGLYGGPGIGKFVVFDPNFFFSCKFFPIFGHQNPGSGSVFSLKCWIRIHIK